MKKILFISALAWASIFSVSQAETLKVGFVADWEYGKQKKYDHKYPSKAKKYLNRAVNYYNSTFMPDVVIGGGDYILSRGVKSKKAKKDLRTVNGIFKRANARRLYCIGNHDLFKMSKSSIREILEMENDYAFLDINGFRLITLDTNDNAIGAGRIPDVEKSWLRETLKSDLPVIIFSHHSPIDTPNESSGGGTRVNLFESGTIRSILEEKGNVVAVFSGHRAINYSQEINGISYVIINNLVDKKALGSFATIDISKSDEEVVSVHVNQYGNRPASYDFSKTIISD